MVTFKEDGYVVEVETVIEPQDNYISTINDLIDIIQASGSSDINNGSNYYHLLELLRAMMPDEAQAKKMIA